VVTVCDPFFADYLKEGEIIESTDLTGEIKGIFMRAGKKVMPLMNYPYRLLCYRRGEGKLLFSVNLEVSSFGTCYFGVDKGDSHYTLRPGIEDMQYEEFREKAIEIAREVIAGELCRDVNPENLYFFK